MEKTQLLRLAKNLKRIRKRRGLSQEDLAEKAFMSVRGYQKYEQGTTWPRPEKLTLLANLLEVNVADLLGERHEDWQEGALVNIYRDEFKRKPKEEKAEVLDEIMELKAQISDLRTAVLVKQKETLKEEFRPVEFEHSKSFDLVSAVEDALDKGKVSPRKRALIMALVASDPSYLKTLTDDEREKARVLLKAL